MIRGLTISLNEDSHTIIICWNSAVSALTVSSSKTNFLGIANAISRFEATQIWLINLFKSKYSAAITRLPNTLKCVPSFYFMLDEELFGYSNWETNQSLESFHLFQQSYIRDGFGSGLLHYKIKSANYHARRGEKYYFYGESEQHSVLDSFVKAVLNSLVGITCQRSYVGGEGWGGEKRQQKRCF